MLEGKTASITINRRGKLLFYTATIEKKDDTHIYFIDKFGERFIYKNKDVEEISNIR